MKKILSFAIFYILFLNYNFAYGHVSHYKSLNKLVFDLYRNNEINWSTHLLI